MSKALATTLSQSHDGSWLAQTDTRALPEAWEIIRWCENEWGHVFRNPRWTYNISEAHRTRITIRDTRDAFAFKMRWL